METIDREYYGGIREETKDTDYQLCAGEVELPVPRHTWKDAPITYNQKEISPVSCFITGPQAGASTLINHKFTLADRKEMWAEALKKPNTNPAVGGLESDGMAITKAFIKNKLGIELRYYRVPTASKEYFDNIKKGYRAVTGFRGNAPYNVDKSDGILDETNLVGSASYAHILTVVDATAYDGEIVDQYPQNGDKNFYKIPTGNMLKLVKNGVFFNDAYFWAYAEDMTPSTTVVSPWAVNSVAKAKAKGIADWSQPQQMCTIELINAVLERIGMKPLPSVITPDMFEATLLSIGALTSQTGLTKERLVVALDRLGKL